MAVSVEWSRSSVPSPMSNLEYDVLAGPYSSGFAAGLSTVFQTPIGVWNRCHLGHLYSALTDGTDRNITAHPQGASLWESQVLPMVQEHFDQLEQLEANSYRHVGKLARLFQQNVFLHHLMLLPIRAQIGQLAANLGVGLAPHPEKAHTAALDVLDVATSRDLPFFTFVEQLIAQEAGALAGGEGIRLSSVAADGDGYGIAIPGWLEDGSYLSRYHRLLLRLGVTPSDLRSRAMTSAARAGDALTRLEKLATSTALRRQVAELPSVAERSRVVELHGPLMHVEYMYRMRRVVVSWGARLAAAGRLDAPECIFHLRLQELRRDAWEPRVVRQRKVRYDKHLSAPLPPPRAEWPLRDAQPLGSTARARLGALSEAPTEQLDGDSWRGIPASPGDASGQLVYLERQADIDKLGPEDIAVTPDGAAAWGWLALAGIPLVVTHGSRLSHAAALARVAGTPCIIAATNPAEVLPPGAAVAMSGDTGRMD